MFGDGLQYALIARNLAEGVGTFWAPRDVGAFVDQPPLALGLQGLAFVAFGDSLHVERLWSLVGVHALLLATPLVLRRAGLHVPVWPFLLLVWVNPHTVWVALNNLLEPTMALFALGAVGASLSGMSSGRLGRSALAGLLVFGAVLCKGPAGLFPLAVPACAALCGTDRRVAARHGLALLVAFALPLAATILGPGGPLLADYLDQQLLPALNGERDAAPQRLFLLKALAQDFGVSLGVAALLWLGAGRPAWTPARLPLLIGLCAALPLLLSPKQARWYLLPATPYLTAWLAMGLREAWPRWEARCSVRGATAVATICLLLTPLAAWATRDRVDPRRAVQADVLELAIDGPVHACDRDLLQSRGLRFALARIHRAELRPPAPGPGLHLGTDRCPVDCPRRALRSLSVWSCGP